MTSERRPRWKALHASSQELLSTWSQQIEATSIAVLGGLRHVRREATLRHRQVTEAINNVRREAGHQIQNCLSHMGRPVSSAPAFAAISAGIRPRPVSELAMNTKQMHQRLNHIIVYLLVQRDGAPLAYSPTEYRKKGAAFVFMGVEEAHAMLKKMRAISPSFKENLKVVGMPLGVFYDAFIKKGRGKKKAIFHFVPDPEEVYYATQVKKMHLKEERERQLEAERAAAEKSEETKGTTSGSSESDKLTTSDSDSDSDSESETDKEEETPIDVSVKGVPIFSCSHLVMGVEQSRPHFFSYRDLDCYMRTSLVNTIDMLVKKIEKDAAYMKHQAEQCRQKATELEGDEATEMLEKANDIEKQRSLALSSRYTVPMHLMEHMNVEVNDLESLLLQWEKEKPAKDGEIVLIPADSIHPAYEENVDAYNSLSRTRGSPISERSPIVPYYLLD